MHDLIHRLLTGDPEAGAEIVEAACTSDDVSLLVAAALLTDDRDEGLLDRAERLASTTRDRQLVTIAVAHRKLDRALVRALARDHLVDHPDSVLAAWIAAASHDQPPMEEER